MTKMVMAVSLYPQSTSIQHPTKLFTDAVAWIMDDHLSHCTITIMAMNDDFSGELSQELVGLLVERKMLYQFQSSRPNEMDLMREVSWKVTNCDAYIFLVQDVDRIMDFLNTDESSYWDWKGRYLILTLSSFYRLSVISQSYRLKRTTDVLFLTPNRGSQELSIYTHTFHGGPPLKLLTSWKGSPPYAPVELFPNKMQDFERRELKVYSFDFKPTMFAKEQPNGSLTDLAGVDYWIIESLGAALNFKPTYLAVGPTYWGELLPNGTFTGIVGFIQRGEGEIGVANLFISVIRTEYVSYTTAVDFTRACLITPSPQELPRWRSILFPFSLSIWILLIVTVFGLGLLVPCLASFLLQPDNEVIHQFSGAMFVVIAYFCNEGFVLPKTSPMKVLLGFSLLAGFITTIYYSSNLTAFMMVKAGEKPYTSFQQIANSDLGITGFGNGWRLMLNASQNEYIKKLAERYTPVPNNMDDIRNVVDRRVALLNSEEGLDYIVRVYYTNKQGESPLRVMKEETLNPFSVGAIVQHHSPILPGLNKVILRLREGGFLKKFWKDSVRLDMHEKFSIEYLNYDADAAEVTPRLQPLSILHIQGTLLLLGIGYLAASLILMMELRCQSLSATED